MVTIQVKLLTLHADREARASGGEGFRGRGLQGARASGGEGFRGRGLQGARASGGEGFRGGGGGRVYTYSKFTYKLSN